MATANDLLNELRGQSGQLADLAKWSAVIARELTTQTEHLSRIAWGVAGLRVDLKGLPTTTGQGAAASAASAGGGMGSFISSLGIAAAGLSGLALAAVPFVQALNPALVNQLNLVFRDLMATIGYALEPIIVGVTQVLRTLAGELRPVFDALRPVIQQLTQIFLNVLRPVIVAFAAILKSVVSIVTALMPVLKLFGVIVEGVVTVLSVLITIFTEIISAIAGAVGGFLRLDNITDMLRSAFVQVALAIVKVVDFVLRMFGAGGVADSVLRSLRQAGNNSGRLAAPQIGGVQTLESIYQQRLIEAAKAGGGQDPMQAQVSILSEIQRNLANWQPLNPPTLRDIISTAIRDALTGAGATGNDLANAAAAAIPGGPWLASVLSRWRSPPPNIPVPQQQPAFANAPLP